jgi:bifunctional DNA-binding transcriptional regulator/antitoxin component of YhaV-PrlF toxin-antitoxin module
MTASGDLVFKKVKVSDKGQISIPIEMRSRREIGASQTLFHATHLARMSGRDL